MENKQKINAQIIADSIDNRGNRITTFILTYPRMIHSELLTHRLFSRNAASSRAIPFKTMVKYVENDPFIPIAWQKDHKGMQGIEYITDENLIKRNISIWKNSLTETIYRTKILNSECEVTKQLCNRLLEPFMWTTVLVTATSYENFFELRCPKYEYYDMLTGNQQFFKSKKDWLQYYNNKPLPKAKHISKIPENDVEWLQINKAQAEIHIQALAEAMWDAMNESNPKQLQAGEWHIPFGDNMNKPFFKREELEAVIVNWVPVPKVDAGAEKWIDQQKVKVATARCARLSYNNFDGEIDYEKDIKLHDRLLSDGHMSPFEHCARAMNNAEYESFYKGQIGLGGESGWCNNFRGFIQYRYLIENGNS